MEGAVDSVCRWFRLPRTARLFVAADGPTAQAIQRSNQWQLWPGV